MSEFVSICPVSELPRAGEAVELIAQGRTLCVANVEGVFAVMDGVCPHEGGPLGEGTVEGGRVVCPWHSYAYDARSGDCQQDASLKVQVFESTVAAGELRAKL
jgi:nitrite reductase (NADH) small subunit